MNKNYDKLTEGHVNEVSGWIQGFKDLSLKIGDQVIKNEGGPLTLHQRESDPLKVIGIASRSALNIIKAIDDTTIIPNEIRASLMMNTMKREDLNGKWEIIIHGPSHETTSINFKKLLSKYVQFVVSNEGTDFLYDDGYTPRDVKFTDEEWKYLLELSKNLEEDRIKNNKL